MCIKNSPFPCGKCPVCKENHRLRWVLRNRLEYLVSKSAYFLTLTYDEEHIENNELNKTDAQKFLKRIRKRLSLKDKELSLRYMLVGEYGTTTGRRHYHALFYFNKYLPPLETEKLVKLSWTLGHSVTKPLNERMTGYVCKYHLKLCPLPFEGAQKPFMLSSRRPALGISYLLQNEQYLRSTPELRKLTIEGKTYYLNSYLLSKIYDDEERKYFTSAEDIKNSIDIRNTISLKINRRPFDYYNQTDAELAEYKRLTLARTDYSKFRAKRLMKNHNKPQTF